MCGVLLSDYDSKSSSSETSEDGTCVWKEEEWEDSNDDREVVPCSVDCSLGEADGVIHVPLLDPLVTQDPDFQDLEAEKEQKSIKETSHKPSLDDVSQGKHIH